MNVPNHEKKPFREMTAEERSAIVDNWLSSGVDIFAGEWRNASGDALHPDVAYRTKPRQLIIPWEVIKPEYKWAAMDESGSVWVYEGKPKVCDSAWGYPGGLDGIGALNIDTTGIDWRESLVQRHEGV